MTAEINVTTVLISVLASLLGGAISSYIAFRIQFEKFRATQEQRDLFLSEWRREVNADLDTLHKSTSATDIAVMRQTHKALTSEVTELAKYTHNMKHRYVDPYIRAVDVLKNRVDELSRDKR